MKAAETNALICLKSSCGLLYNLGKMIYVEKEDGNQQIDYSYTFIPNWRVIDLLRSPEFQGIPGFDLTARKTRYIRKNMTPTFIAERAPSANREDLWELLEECDMTYLNQLEWLKRTNKRYIGDDLVVCPLSEFEKYTGQPFELEKIVAQTKNTEDALRTILRVICANGVLFDQAVPISDEAIKVLHDCLRPLYEKIYQTREKKRIAGIQRAAGQGLYKGRKRKSLDTLILEDVIGQYESGHLDADSAANRLGVAKSTFYRRLNEARANSGRER